jgi:predicted transcriptional regulator
MLRTCFVKQITGTAFSNYSTNRSPTSAINLFKNSCYNKVDYKINKESSAKDAVDRFTAFNVGCLAVTDNTNKIVGVLSERDYINKVASTGKPSETTKVGEICTYGPIIVANKNDSLETCMSKMMFKDIRHLLILDDAQECVGMISIKDLIKEIVKDKNETINRLSFFNMGKGAYFGSE